MSEVVKEAQAFMSRINWMDAWWKKWNKETEIRSARIELTHKIF